jgi:hypothetical protein
MTRILTALMLLIPAWALAAPVQVTLFPASGMVTEISAAACEPADDGLWACTLTLPGQADPATLRFGRLPGKASVTDLSWTNRRDPDQAVLAPLLARLAELQAERDAARAELEGVRARMNFWKAQTRPEPQSLAAMRELAEEMDRNLHSGTKWSQELEGTIKDLDKAIADVEARIAGTCAPRFRARRPPSCPIPTSCATAAGRPATAWKPSRRSPGSTSPGRPGSGRGRARTGPA